MTESHEESRQEEEEGWVPPKEGEGEGQDVMYPASNPDGLPRIKPGAGGYDDRDPAKEIPRMPSIPETQDD